jgi:hypothetical protein
VDVRVHESGNDHLAGRVDALRVVRRVDVLARADIGDGAVLDEDARASCTGSSANPSNSVSQSK